ncbi:7-deoxyloganetic acid glucosyltransferase [Quercus suber]|uniref:7-deoxyloganetic acid glucosyltransferase n=1 Tax=Quercus suber TaxID=58331 RepID=A0AAW0KU74_QUESU
MDMKDMCDRFIVEKMVNHLMEGRTKIFIKSIVEKARLAKESVTKCGLLTNSSTSFCRASYLADPNLQYIKNITRQSPQAHALILNTFEDLEGLVLSYIRTKCPKTYTIGPLHAILKSKLESKMALLLSWSLNSLFEVNKSFIVWLNAQPLKSVIYVSFGSIIVMTKEELIEFWYGLINSKKHFLWL